MTVDCHCQDATVWPAVRSAAAVGHSAAAVHSFAAVVRHVGVCQHVGVAHYAEVTRLVEEVHSVAVVVDRWESEIHYVFPVALLALIFHDSAMVFRQGQTRLMVLLETDVKREHR